MGKIIAMKTGIENAVTIRTTFEFRFINTKYTKDELIENKAGEIFNSLMRRENPSELFGDLLLNIDPLTDKERKSLQPYPLEKKEGKVVNFNSKNDD